MPLEGIGGVLGNCMSSHVCIRKLEDSHFPPHNNSYTYDPQIMRQTAKLDLVPPYPLHNMIHTHFSKLSRSLSKNKRFI
jgi:hypothetical protein